MSCVAMEYPFDVLEDEKLSYEEKLALLKSWAWDTHELLVADDENMKGGNDAAGDLLEDIRQTITKLKDEKNVSDCCYW